RSPSAAGNGTTQATIARDMHAAVSTAYPAATIAGRVWHKRMIAIANIGRMTADAVGKPNRNDTSTAAAITESCTSTARDTGGPAATAEDGGNRSSPTAAMMAASRLTAVPRRGTGRS